MNFRCSLATLMISVSLFGCATSADHGVSVPLVATRQNTGQIGNVTLTSWEKQTGLSFFITGAPSGATLPLRLYSFIHKGTCQQSGPVAFAMNDKVNTQREPVRGWSFSRSAPIALQDLLSSEYSIVVRTAPESGNVDIFCGDIKQGGAVK